MKIPSTKTELWYLDESTNNYLPLNDSSSLPVSLYSQDEIIIRENGGTAVPPSLKVELYYYDTKDHRYKPLVVNGKIPITLDGEIGGGGGGDSSAIDISEVPYDINDVSSKNLKEIIDELIYVAPSVTAFSVNPSVVEKGTVVNNLTLSWNVNKSITTQSINQGIGTIGKDIRSYTVPSAVTNNVNYTITINDGKTSANRSASISFRNKIHYGVSGLTSLTNSDILNLSGELATSKVKTATFNPNNQYIYFVFPTAFGTPSFKVNGLTNDAWIVTTMSHTNSQGYSESYTIYRSEYEQNGVNIIIEVT